MRNGARKTRRERRNGAPQIEHGRTYCASLCVRGKKLTDRLFVSYSTTQHPCYLRSSDNCHDPVTGLGGWDHLEPKSVQDQVRHGWHATVHRKQNNNNIAVLRSTCSSQTTSAPRYTHFDEILLIDGRFPFICSQPAVALKGGHNCAGKNPKNSTEEDQVFLHLKVNGSLNQSDVNDRLMGRTHPLLLPP